MKQRAFGQNRQILHNLILLRWKNNIQFFFSILYYGQKVKQPMMQSSAVTEKEARNMIMDGCQGKPRTPTIEDRICPNCGNPIEIFSTDTEVACDRCGFVVYNDKLSCVQWCKYAKQCVGEETYEKLMVIARRNQEKADAERRARLEAKNRQEGQV